MASKKENIYLIPNWFRSSCSQTGVFQNFAKFTRKHLCVSYFLTMFQVSRPEISLKRGSGTGIFLWFFRNSSKSFIYRTPPDDCSCWFLHFNQHFYALITLCSFFPLFYFFLLLIIAIMSLLKKYQKMKIFLLLL